MLKVTRVAFVASLCYVATAGAQASPAPARGLAPTGLLRAVLGFRYDVVESSTPIIACTVVKLMDTPRDFPNAFPIVVQNIFDRRAFPCEPKVEKPMLDSLTDLSMRNLSNMPRDPGCVFVDSVRRVDSLATVYAHVRRNGDAVHREEFKAVFQASRRDWYVKEARMYGLWYPHGGGC